MPRMCQQVAEECSIIMRLGTRSTSFMSRLLYANVKRVFRPRTEPNTVMATKMLPSLPRIESLYE